MKRKNILTEGEVYHIFSRSIAGYEIFNDDADYDRMLQLFKFFQVKEPPVKFSEFIGLKAVQRNGFYNYFHLITKGQTHLIQIIAYCLMPTHIHLILKQLGPKGISIFTGKVLDSYSRYFNTKHQRKGPLWESKFKNVIVDTDEQLLHLTRYNHLNPVTAKLVDSPEDWQFSSYREYLGNSNLSICRFNDLLSIDPEKYAKFVKDRIGYQRQLSIIKKQMLD